MPDIVLPTFHTGQVRVFNRSRTEGARLNVVRCGRRWGKTKMMVALAGDACAKGNFAGLFAPEHKQIIEPYDDLREILQPLGGRFNKTDGIIRPLLPRARPGRLDFWTLNDNELAGRGREYHRIGLDEVAFTKRNMMDIWEKSIRPTLLTTRGEVWAFSTPKGVDEENFFWRICNDKSLGFLEHHAPTLDNPMIDAEELEDQRRKNHPLVFKQEYLAEFVDWSGVSFFELAKMLHDGQPVPYPKRTNTVFAVIDTAIKTGKEHDGTAVIYFAYDQSAPFPLVVLDWDITQIEGALLEEWLPNVYTRIDELARVCGTRYPPLGAWIEDKGSGMILIQQAQRREWPATAIPSELTAVGKDERAISVSGYVYQGLVKLSDYAYNKLTEYKGVVRNHLSSQIFSFRIGDKDPKRADDLTDCLTYGISLTLGNSRGY